MRIVEKRWREVRSRWKSWDVASQFATRGQKSRTKAWKSATDPIGKPCFWWRRLSGDRTVVNFTMWSWVGLNVFMLIWRECLVLGDVRPASIATSEHGVGWGGVGDAWGGLITFMSAAGRMWCYVMLRRSDVEVTSNGVGWGGWGGLIAFMSAAGWMWCYGMLRCEDVEVTSGTLWMLRCEDVEVTSGTLWMLRCEDVEVTSGTLWMLRCEDVEAESNWWNPGVGSNLGWFEVFLAKTTLNTSADRRPIEVATQQICVGLAVETPQNWTWLGFIGLGLDLLQELGKLMKSINKKIGYWKWADRRCKKASNVFREYVFEIHFFQKSRFHYSENDTKLILRRVSEVFEPFFNIDRARFMNKVLRFTVICALNL